MVHLSPSLSLAPQQACDGKALYPGRHGAAAGIDPIHSPLVHAEASALTSGPGFLKSSIQGSLRGTDVARPCQMRSFEGVENVHKPKRSMPIRPLRWPKQATQAEEKAFAQALQG